MKLRLDKLLLERGLAPSRERAQALILAGKVLVDGQKIEKAGTAVEPAANIRLLGEDLKYVSRGGLKLDKALEHWNIDVQGKVCLDVGASTGGFTDCLLQRGAREVIAVDVGYGILDYRLRSDPRVSVMERTNARTLTPAMLPAARAGADAMPDLATVDVSFISLAKVLGAVLGCVGDGYDVLALVKPQFELGRGRVGKGGVVRAAEDRREALVGAGEAALELGAAVVGYRSSGLSGPKGNLETFVWLTDPAVRGGTRDPAELERMAREVEP